MQIEKKLEELGLRLPPPPPPARKRGPGGARAPRSPRSAPRPAPLTSGLGRPPGAGRRGAGREAAGLERGAAGIGGVPPPPPLPPSPEPALASPRCPRWSCCSAWP